MPIDANINAIIGDLSDMLSRTVGEQIQIETHLANDLWNSFIDPSQLDEQDLHWLAALTARSRLRNRGS